MAMKKFLIALIVIFSLFAMSACKISVKYNVDFYVDGALYATVGTDGDVLTMPNDPEKEGYSFEGWFWDETSREKPFTLASLLDQPLSEENRYSVYAQFSEIDYSQFLSVEGFALQDGTFRAQVPNATDRLDLEGKISLGEGVPYFLSADEAGNDRMDSLVLSLKEGDNRFYLQVQNATKTVSVALDVRRAPLYTVTFDPAGGTAVSSQKVEEGQTAAAPEAPERTGYTFRAWSPALTTPILSDMTFTAVWEGDVYTVRLDAAGGTLAQQTVQAVSGQIPQFPLPERTGYTFEGWYLGSERVDNAEWSHYEDAEVRAAWEPILYSISYVVGEDVRNEENPSSYSIETPTFSLSAPVRAGAEFCGWYADEALTHPLERIEEGTTGDLTLYPKWELISYSITYHLDGGTQNPQNPSSYDIETALVFLLPTKKDYMFEGWYENAACTGDPLSSELLPGEKIGQLELWAKWQYGTEGLLFAESFYSPGKWMVSGYIGTCSDVVIPSVYTEDGIAAEVAEIGRAAFKDNQTVCSVNIPSSVRHIDDLAFYGCALLRRVNSLSGIQTFGTSAFDECPFVIVRVAEASVPQNANWANIGAPILFQAGEENCTEIGGAGYRVLEGGASLYRYYGEETSFSVPDAIPFRGEMVPVTEIGESAFQASSLQSLTVARGIEIIGENAFAFMPALSEFHYNAENAICYGERGCFGFMDGQTLKVAIGADVRMIPSQLFYQAGVCSLTFEEGVTLTIGESAFERALLPQELVLSKRVCEIGSRAFFEAQTGELTFESGSLLRVIGASAFTGAKLECVILPQGLFEIGSEALACGLKRLYLPISVQVMGFGALSFSAGAVVDVEAFSAPVGWQSTDWMTMQGITVNLGAGSLREGDYSYVVSGAGVILTKYYGTFGASVVLPDTLAGKPVVGFGALFSGNTALASVTLPASLELVAHSAFRGCTGLVSIAVPASVKEIGGYAFEGCTGLETVTFAEGSMLSSVGDYAFAHCGALRGIAIPAKTERIGNYAFLECKQLSALTFEGQSLLTIGREAFRASGVRKTELPNSLLSLGFLAFFDGALTEVRLSDSLKELPMQAFAYNPDLRIVTGGKNLETIGDYCFSGCTALAEFVLPDGLRSVGMLSFFECSALKELILPASVQSIGTAAFDGCGSLTLYLEAEESAAPQNLPARCVFGWTTAGEEKYAVSFVKSAGGLSEIPVPEREGYTFVGWFLNEQCTGTSYRSDVSGVADGTRLYAKWEKA